MKQWQRPSASPRTRPRDPVAVPLVLRRHPSLKVVHSLALRAALAVGLMGVALAGHWFDRAGLRDNVDGHVSFVDVLYFTSVTVTTVGYGDIVPVTPRTRLFDTFVVTPIRLFIWLIFLGTAYTLVLRHTWDRRRTRLIAKSLDGHHVLCGFGAGGHAAVTELLRQGVSPTAIVVIDSNEARCVEAMDMGVTALNADATHNAALEAARISRAGAVLVSMGRDDTVALVVLSARRANARVPISASVREIENEELVRQAGATSIINPVILGGHLLARASTHRGAVDYIRDLAAADGSVALRERVATGSDIGKPLGAIATGLGVRLTRKGRPIGFWQPDARAIEAGDVIIEIVAVGGAGGP